VQFSQRDFADVKLFFDMETGLLGRTERKTKDGEGNEVVQEQIYSDFKDVQGARLPMKMLILQNGKRFLQGEMIEVKPLDRLDDSVFAKPS
jgi:hypothetical protein